MNGGQLPPQAPPTPRQGGRHASALQARAPSATRGGLSAILPPSAPVSDQDRVTILDPGVGTAAPVLLGDLASVPAGRACFVPDFIGLGFLDAYALASAAGLRLSVSVWETKVGPWGRVLDQKPDSTQRIRRGGRIAIRVSGRPHEQVPDVGGLPLGDAVDRLAWLGLVPLVDSRRPSRSVSVGQVLATRPSPGALLAGGSVVALTVASAPREQYARTMSDLSDDR